jgi:hypothetical protein
LVKKKKYGVEILGYRGLDEHNKTDLPVKSLDGLLDIIELKLPDSLFWNSDNSPTADLTKATGQVNNGNSLDY